MLLFRGSDVYLPNQSPEALQALKEKMIDWVIGLSQRGPTCIQRAAGNHWQAYQRIWQNGYQYAVWGIKGNRRRLYCNFGFRYG